MALEPLWSLNRRLEQRRGLSRAGASLGRRCGGGIAGTGLEALGEGGQLSSGNRRQQGCGSVGRDGMGRLAMNEKKKKKKWGGLKSTAMEMKHRRLIKDSLEEQRGLGSLSSLSHTCWCSSGPIYYRPRLHPTTTTSEIFMSASSVFYVLSARFQIFLLSPSPGTQHLGALRRQKTTILQEYCCQCLLVLQTHKRLVCVVLLFPFCMTTLYVKPESHCLRE